MKIYFEKKYNYYMIASIADDTRNYRINEFTYNYEWIEIIKKIRKIFKSVVTHDIIVLSGRGHTFSFDDVADEAHFILWAKDGIEI